MEMSMKEGDSSTGSENISANPSTLNSRNGDDDDIVFVAEVDRPTKNIATQEEVEADQEEAEADQDEVEAEQAVNRPIEEIVLSSDSETDVEVIAVIPAKRQKILCDLLPSRQDQYSMVQSNKDNKCQLGSSKKFNAIVKAITLIAKPFCTVTEIYDNISKGFPKSLYRLKKNRWLKCILCILNANHRCAFLRYPSIRVNKPYLRHSVWGLNPEFAAKSPLVISLRKNMQEKAELIRAKTESLCRGSSRT